MSRHYCDTVQGERSVRVTLGYDRPLDYFHLMIERISDSEPVDSEPVETTDDEDEAGFIYCNLADPELPRGQCTDLDYYRGKLRELGITVPESMFRETELDAVNHVGNRVVRHHQDGTTEPALALE